MVGIFVFDAPDKYRLFLDGNQWCAIPPHFVNLQESPAGFGNTPEEAVSALLAEREFQEWLVPRMPPTVADFVVCYV